MSQPRPMSARRKTRLWTAALAASGAALLIAGMSHLGDQVRALSLLCAARPSSTGHNVVGSSTIRFTVEPYGIDVPVTLYYPAAGAMGIGGRLATLANVLAHPNRARTVPGAPLLEGVAPLHLVIYFPSWFSQRDENSFTLANLASHGLIVASLDDVVHLAPMRGDDRIAQGAGLDFSSERAFAASRVLAGRRAALEARFGSAVLDHIIDAPGWGEHIDASHVGALGFSFGGSAAAAMSRSDPRVQAVVNLDGWVFGEVAESGVDVPNLTLWSDEPFPTEQDLSQPDLAGRLRASLDRRTIEQQLRQDIRPDSWTFLISRTDHVDFSDRLWRPGFFDRGRAHGVDRARAWSDINGAIVGFLDAFLRGRPTLMPAGLRRMNGAETLEFAVRHPASNPPASDLSP